VVIGQRGGRGNTRAGVEALATGATRKRSPKSPTEARTEATKPLLPSTFICFRKHKRLFK
jgi:hypothetical protein